jgi:hypothetical protein
MSVREYEIRIRATYDDESGTSQDHLASLIEDHVERRIENLDLLGALGVPATLKDFQVEVQEILA